MFSFAFLCTSPDNNKLLTDDIRYLGVGGHLFAIAAQKSVDYGYDGYMYGFAANKELLDHYVETFNGEVIGVLHPYQFAIDEVNAKKIMEVYDMTGQMKKYRDSLEKTPEPVLLSQIQTKMDLRGLMHYAKEKGKKVMELSEKERMSFIKK